MFRRALMAFTGLVSAAGLSAAAHATTFGFGFAVEIGGGIASIGSGQLFTTDNGDNTFTVTGADGAAAFFDFNTFETYGEDTIIGAGPSWFTTDAVATIIFANGIYSFDNLQLVGNNFYYDFSHFNDPAQLTGLVGEVGGPAQFQFGPLEGAVPEIATWGMMVMGFGVVGATMRRRTTVSFA